MPATYEPIATTTLGSSSSSVTFSSIPGTYTDLVMVFNGVSSGSNDMCWQANNDTGSNYSATRMSGNGSTASSTRFTNSTSAAWGWNNNSEGVSILQIMNYSNTTTYKTSLGRGDTAGAFVGAYVGLWRSTSAITSIKIMNGDGATYNSGSTFTLYGIKAA